MAERYLAQGDGASAQKWAGDCLHINVYDPVIHVLLGDAQTVMKEFEHAAEEFQVALTLKPKKPDDVKVKLARASSGTGQHCDQAKATLEGVLQGRPRSPRGQGASAGDRQGQKWVRMRTGLVLFVRCCDGLARSDRNESESPGG